MLRTLITASLICCTMVTAIAQTTDIPVKPIPKTTFSRGISTRWPGPATNPDYRFHNLDVVTRSQPDKRQHCHTRSITETAIVCRSNLAKKITTFQREDVIAMIAPPEHGDLWATILAWSLAGAGMAGSFFVPLGWSITLRILSPLIFFASCDDEYNPDHSDDILLYQRPNTPLTIHLRAH